MVIWCPFALTEAIIALNGSPPVETGDDVKLGSSVCEPKAWGRGGGEAATGLKDDGFENGSVADGGAGVNAGVGAEAGAGAAG